MKKILGWMVVAFLALGLVSNAVADPDEPTTATVDPVSDPVAEPAEEPVTTSPEPTPTEDPAVELLFITDQKDGDSWDASDGREYRVGQVNTPEHDEPCGPEATAFTRDFLTDGFTADAYSSDTYDRTVAEIFDKEGESLNVALARSGLGNDRYLEQFRSENPDLASRLDDAFASAATPDCAGATEPVPFAAAPAPAADPGAGCMPEYSPCVPAGPDLDCPDIAGPVAVTGGDPFRLDRDGDGIGCD